MNTSSNTFVPCGEFEASACVPIRKMLSRVGDKWSLQVIGTLSSGAMRFNAIGREIEGISQRMLTLTLRELERDGMVTRRVEDTLPPSVYYELTVLGTTLTEPVFALVQWVRDHQTDIETAQAQYDEKNKLKRHG